VTLGRTASVSLLFVAIAAGTVSDRPPANTPPLVIGGYRVLAADFHVHPAIVSAGALTPWDLVLEARRQGLDAFAITPHNQVFPAKIGRWFSMRTGGPTVIVGEEIRGPSYHLIALGIDRRIGWREDAAATIDEVHRQGGAAIAAHPTAAYWAAYDARALAKLDGSEVMHPIVDEREWARGELQEFYRRGRFAAIGSSDYHGLGTLGQCRTYVFASDDSEQAIVSAIRAGHTVVYDTDGRAYGNAELIRLAAQDGRVRAREPLRSDPGILAIVSRIAGILGLLGAVLFASRP
jgi:hypothetical protein